MVGKKGEGEGVVVDDEPIAEGDGEGGLVACVKGPGDATDGDGGEDVDDRSDAGKEFFGRDPAKEPQKGEEREEGTGGTDDGEQQNLIFVQIVLRDVAAWIEAMGRYLIFPFYQSIKLDTVGRGLISPWRGS